MVFLFTTLACQEVDSARRQTAETGETAETGDSGTTVPACGEEDSPQRYCASCAAWADAHPGDVVDAIRLQTPAGGTLSAACELTRGGGGWTLLATNAWGGGWTPLAIVDGSSFGEPSLTDDFKSPLVSQLPFTDLMFENDAMYAVYAGIDRGTRAYRDFSASVPVHNCGIDTPWVWPMTEGDLAGDYVCETSLYMHAADWEGGVRPCEDSEWTLGPVWSVWSKDHGCPLNDPRSASFIEDKWDENPWGDRDPARTNQPLRMWAR